MCPVVPFILFLKTGWPRIGSDCQRPGIICDLSSAELCFV